MFNMSVWALAEKVFKVRGQRSRSQRGQMHFSDGGKAINLWPSIHCPVEAYWSTAWRRSWFDFLFSLTYSFTISLDLMQYTVWVKKVAPWNFSRYFHSWWTCVIENYFGCCPTISLRAHQFWSIYLNICVNCISFSLLFCRLSWLSQYHEDVPSRCRHAFQWISSTQQDSVCHRHRSCIQNTHITRCYLLVHTQLLFLTLMPSYSWGPGCIATKKYLQSSSIWELAIKYSYD